MFGLVYLVMSLKHSDTVGVRATGPMFPGYSMYVGFNFAEIIYSKLIMVNKKIFQVGEKENYLWEDNVVQSVGKISYGNMMLYQHPIKIR